jgi:lipopolysaccharide/colanic/teichoic acid biosynthesis glycosyltransferase
VIRPFTTSQRFQLVLKRALDVALATVALLLLGVFLVLIAATIKATSPGPILFRQRRVGLNGEIFEIFKFRTMHFSQEDLTGVRQTSLADERVTPIGKVLRRASVDELPQLINVLRGEMSLVGPRPHVLGMLAAGTPYEQLVPYYTVRQIVRPGVTGWAQAHGLRGPTDDAAAAKARVDHDIAYIQNFGVWLDVRTIFYTIAVELRRGAGV